MKEITLSKGKVALVDDEYFLEIEKYKWCASEQGRKNHKKWYAVRWRQGCKPKVKVWMHREILGLGDYKDDPRIGHHEDCNGLNNQKYNLGIAKDSQDNMLKEPGWKRKKKVECFL